MWRSYGSPDSASRWDSYFALGRALGYVRAVVGGGAFSRSDRGVRRSARTAWVSGAPKRQLNSMTWGPVGVSARPAYRRPVKGTPRAAISSTTGWTMVARIVGTRSSDAQGRG